MKKQFFIISKKICLLLLVLLGLTFVIKDINIFTVKAENNILEIKNENLDFTLNSNQSNTYETNNFKVTFSNEVTSTSTTGITLNVNETFNIVPKVEGKHITKIEFIGDYNGDDYNVLEVITAKDGIVSYDQYDYDMNEYMLKTISDNSIVEYPSTTVDAQFEVVNEVNIKEIIIYYQEEEPVNYTILNFYEGSITFKNSKYTGVLLNGDKLTNAPYEENVKFYIVQAITDTSNNNIVKYNEPIDSYQISFLTAEAVTMEIVLDDIWSSYATSMYGGLSVPAHTLDTAKIVKVRLKGVNRFTRINYWTHDSTDNKSSLTFTSYYGDGSKEGKLIAIGKQTYKSNSVHGHLAMNGWNATIGGDDSYQNVRNLNFAGGTILAVATAKDQCTAIGSGGNGNSTVNITGGSVTAIAYTTGTAIGGGIGHLSAGGTGTINISGGEVYAYNFGQPYQLTCEGSTQKAYKFVPGTAIGGGSSYQADGAKGTVTITGGKVYAYSNGGSGLGGGNSIKGKGGTANITISGGEVTSYGYIPNDEAVKVNKIISNLQSQVLDKTPNGGTVYKDYNNNSVDIISPFNHGGANGSGIGGGSGKEKDGGTATISISGGILDASSIGGGNSTNASGAIATVTVSGGTTICETIGGGFSNINGYENGFVYVTGGSLNAAMSAIPQVSKTNSSMLYLTRVSILDIDNNQLTNSQIDTLIFRNSYDYGENDLYTDKEGIVYLWLPRNADITGCEIQGKITLFEPFEELDGMISPYEIGILKETQNNKYNYHVTTVNTEFYTLYNQYEDGVLSKELENTTVVSHNTYFTIYAKIKSGYSANVYYAVELANGNKVFQQATTTQMKGNITFVGLTITQHTTIMFEVISNYSSERYYVMDLYNGNINITEEDGQFIVEQNGYKFPLSNGQLYLTSGGIATPNTVSVDINQDSNGVNNEVGIHLNNIVVGSSNSCLSILSGKVTLETGESNDIIHSQNQSAIYIEENAELVINSDGNDAIKISTQDTSISPVSGKGKVVFNNQEGYFKILSSNGTPGFSVGIYECSGRNEVTAELFVGEFEFELIGYIQTKSGVTTLYDSSVDMSSNKDPFAARGVYKVLNGVTASKSSSANVVDGNYVINLTATGTDAVLGEIYLTQGNNTLHEGVYYKIEKSSDGKSCVLTIYGSSFEDGNIMIFAASDQLIAYQIISYSGSYDGLDHGISVAVNTNQFIVTYSTEIDGVYTTTNPTIRDVTPIGGIKVYIKIDPIKSDTNYIPVSGVYGTITITQGTNEFLNTLSCPDVIYENGAAHSPTPSITAKWGTVTYKYYKDKDCTIIANTFEKETYYYVKAFVSKGLGSDGTTINYQAISTNYAIRFRVVEVLIRTQPSKSLSKVNGTATSITVPLNGAFTVLYKATASSLDNMTLRFDNNNVSSTVEAVPVGTKITFIDFNQEYGVNQYYYYYVSASDISGTSVIIKLNQFIKMGTKNTTYTKDQQNIAVEFQFCIEFPETRKNSGEISVSLTGTSDGSIKTINVIPTVQSKEEISITNTTFKENKYSVDLQVKSNSVKAKQVLVVYLDTNNINDLDFKLINPTGAEIQLIYSTGKYLYFLLASSSTIDNKYTFIVENIGEASVNISLIKFNIRSTDSDVPYVLEGSSQTNSVSTQNITIDSLLKIEFIAKIADDKYLITQDESIKFSFKVNENNGKIIDYSQLTVTIYRKNQMGVYESITNPIVWIFGEREVAVDSLDKYLPDGYASYKLIFNYKGVESTVYFVIKK